MKFSRYIGVWRLTIYGATACLAHPPQIAVCVLVIVLELFAFGMLQTQPLVAESTGAPADIGLSESVSSMPLFRGVCPKVPQTAETPFLFGGIRTKISSNCGGLGTLCEFVARLRFASLP
jgi:hypothetical protein